MADFDKYFLKKEIILQLCNIRAKIADKRSQKHLVHLLTRNQKHNYHVNISQNKESLDDVEKQLMDLLPPRKKWKKLIKKHRYNNNNQRINSLEYNKKSLFITIDHYINDPCLNALNEFIEEIQSAINDPGYSISEPEIIPEIKDKSKRREGVCRPISKFSLKDQIIIGVTNKYLTDVFDEYFDDDYSFAFRSAKRGLKLSHHEAVKSILAFRENSTQDHLWVAECDISKFFDCLHHTIIKRHFKRLTGVIKKKTAKEIDSRAEGIFYKYLKCYSFPKNILKYETDQEYWEKKHKIKDGSFAWEEDKLNKLKCFKKVRLARVGIPQGGALSGLIANLVMDYADRQIKKIKDPDLHYVRFCDDMIILHPKEDKCKEALDVYERAIQRLHLIPADFFEGKLVNSRESFWNPKTKSKGPYRWSSTMKDSLPWFGFVGYEMHYDGHIRIRRSSIQKEKRKQREVVDRVIRAVSNSRRKSTRTVFESAANRLVGMSVGRVTMKNYKKIDPDLCWAKSFVKVLNSNPCSRRQMKDMDRYRNKQLARLVKVLRKKDDSLKNMAGTVTKFRFTQIRGVSDRDSARIRQQLRDKGILNKKYRLNPEAPINVPDIDLGLSPEYERYRDKIIEVLENPLTERYVSFYGKPFSYYYHLIEKKQIIDSEP